MFYNCCNDWKKARLGYSLCGVLMLISMDTIVSKMALAKSIAQQYNIPAQSLNNALIKFADAAKLALIFNSDVVRGINTKALQGLLTHEQALGLLLQDTGLGYRFIDEHTVTLEQKTEIQSQVRHKNAQIPEKTASNEPVVLENMLVIGHVQDELPSYQANGFIEKDALTATKTNTPIKEIPQSIQVIPKTIMLSQQNLTVSESLHNVSGVVARNTLYSPVMEGTIIRGFASEQLVDGFTQYYNSGDRESMVNIDRLEVLKGSNAVLYGGGSGAPVGGVVNILSKLPKETAFRELGFKLGSNSFYQPFLDVNQPLNKNALFRMTGEYTNSESYINTIETDRYNVNPSILLTHNKTTKLILQSKFSRWQQPDYQGLPATGTVAGDFKINPKTFIGPANIPNSHSDSDAVWGTLEHQISDAWDVTLKSRYSQSKFDQKVQTLFGADGFSADRPFMAPGFWALANARLFEQQEEFSVAGTSQHKFDIGKTQNIALLGADYSDLNDKGFVSGDFGPTGLGVGTLNFLKPEFISPYLIPEFNTNNQLVKNKTYGGYAQLQSTVFKHLHLLSSLRLGTVSIDYQNTLTDTHVKTDELRLLPRFGAVFDVTQQLSVFASYNEGMRGQPFLNFVGTPSAAISKQIEGGIKFDIPQQLSGQLAVYQIDRSHVAVTDRSDVLFRSIAKGQQQSNGIELDMLWHPINNVNVLATYAHTVAEFKDSLAGVPAGNRLELVPENSGRLWGSYALPSAVFKGLSVGTGVYMQSEAFLSKDNRFKSDAYYSIDAAINYEIKQFKLATTFKNLTDEHYFEAYDYFDARVAPSVGRSVYLVASMLF